MFLQWTGCLEQYEGIFDCVLSYCEFMEVCSGYESTLSDVLLSVLEFAYEGLGLDIECVDFLCGLLDVVEVITDFLEYLQVILKEMQKNTATSMIFYNFNNPNPYYMEAMIYSSPYELKAAFEKSLREWLFPFERSDINQETFLPDRDTFEVVDFGGGEKRLFPAEYQYPYFFRGQGRTYDPCLPSIYRPVGGKEPDDVDVFTDRMRVVEFTHLIDSHPVVRGFFKRHGYHVDYTGLAQHYGLRTDMLDITTDIDVALFFAMCPYDKRNDRYSYHDDEEDHEGVIYLLMPFYNDFKPYDAFEKIVPIGLQIFDRPGRQKGFAYRLDKGETLYARMYRFKFTSQDSLDYFKRYQEGDYLWCKDILVEKAAAIAVKHRFAYSVFKRAFDQYPVKGYSKTRLKAELAKRSIDVDNKADVAEFTCAETDGFIKEWYETKNHVLRKLITRKRWVLSEKEEDGVRASGKWFHYRNREMLWVEHCLRVMMCADAVCPEGSVLVGNAPAFENPKDGNWRRYDARFFDAIASPFLSEEDMKLTY